ncbi:hypothetical protein GHT06_008336 [Daphnia sinensis]|uniref:Uncharacterized protein n=1 Tax=Daphnia sinensis TaxID=1820382 RepID=A0AAD5LKV6_9CRUS|nr:hypothetical protein GHT06_008336 [Daphnia sinensis]
MLDVVMISIKLDEHRCLFRPTILMHRSISLWYFNVDENEASQNFLQFSFCFLFLFLPFVLITQTRLKFFSS